MASALTKLNKGETLYVQVRTPDWPVVRIYPRCPHLIGPSCAPPRAFETLIGALFTFCLTVPGYPVGCPFGLPGTLHPQ
eukprot:2980123-Pyramimonas_sp.AAC.1